MKICSYTWQEWNEEEGKYVEKQCPEEIWKTNKRLCIFHDPSQDKDIKLFKQKMEEKLAKKDYNFRGYFFPELWNFENFQFCENVSFDGATFQKDVDFHGVTFQEKASFDGATFQDAFFGRAIFYEKASFDGATFQERTFFDGAVFQGEASFDGTIFHNASFDGAVFQGEASFDGATFQKDASFHGITFQKDASFGRVTFQKDASFDGATFQDAFLYRVTFHGKVSFDGAVFQGKTSFDRTIFHEKASFGRATFQDASFDGVTFQDASFDGVTFQDASFDGVTIEKNMEFVFDWVEKLNLANTKFLFRGNITANLAKANFHRAFLENIVFIDCKWPEKIYEEIHMEDDGLTFKELETIYRNLKQNMQRHGDYDMAGKFFYREMEMKKKGSENKMKRAWLEIYNLLAGYGERPERTAFSSLFTISAFALLYWTTECLQHTVKKSIENPTIYQELKDAIYFSFVTFTTLGLGDISPVNDLGKFLICCEAVIGAFLIALFVVVFARKMMR
ncbi:MAG: hypothetical protein AYK18_14330 [Theionarchaea archaeon DG-70]|nr:MAG: hypothetical protein AYK18_14330 [Theionarchaea archaeon DG-70]